MSTDDIDALFGEGLPIGDDLVIKASLRVPVRRMRFPAAQAMVDHVTEKYEARIGLLMADIQAALDADLIKSEDMRLVISSGRVLLKAAGAGAPIPPKKAASQPQQPKAQPKTVDASGERKKTAHGYNVVVHAGSRGGQWWMDEKGNVRYGDRPSGKYQKPAEPQHVVEHFQKFQAPTVFSTTREHPDLFEALQNSEVLSNSDAVFMQWWKDNLDEFLGNFSLTQKKVEKAGGLNAVAYPIGGRDVSLGEAVEMFFRANAEIFVGDPDFGEPEDEEDVVAAIRGLMDRYHKALTEDPNVKAIAIQRATEREQKTNAFYINAEQSHEEFDPLAGDLMTVQDAGDIGIRMAVAMKQLGLLEKNTAAKVGRGGARMRGALVPNSAMLWTGDKKSLGSLWTNDQLERLNAGQLAATFMASRAQDSLTDDATYEYDPQELGQFSSPYHSRVFDLIASKLGIESSDESQRKALQLKLETAVAAQLQMLTKYNTGQDPHLTEIFSWKVKDVAGKDNVIDEYMKRATDRQQWIDDVLAAQEDEKFDIPDTMKTGVWNGKTLRNPEKPELGVWEPLRYQKKYVNWMAKVKRGVIAADAGLGKTPTVITFMEKLRAEGKDQAAILFLPPSLMEQWPQEIARFAPDMQDKVLNLNGLSLEERKIVLQSDMAKDARYIIISTGTLTGDKDDPNASEEENDGTGGTDEEMTDILRNIEGAVFIDEVHQGGYKKAGNSRHEIAKKVLEGREHAFGMTATPMPNDPMDLFHLCDLFAPGSVGDEDLWRGRMAGAVWDDDEGKYKVTHPEHLADLNKRLKPFVYYKSIMDPDIIEDMGKGLPDKVGVHEVKEMWPSEGDLSLSRHSNSENGLSQNDYFKEDGVIDQMVKLRVERLIRDRLEAIDKGMIDPKTGEVFKPYNPRTLQLMAGGMKINLHRQASISPGLIDPSYRKADGALAHSPKLKALCDDVEAHFSNGGQGGEDAKPLVVFSSYPQKAWPLVKKALAERGIHPSRVGEISGDVSPTERGYMQDMLNAGHMKVLLVGTLSGGAGLNLQKAANKMLFLDEPYSPAQKRQAQGRVWRTGQESTVFEKTYRTEGTFDSAVEQKVANKQVMVSALLGKEAPTAETFEGADEDVRRLVGRIKGTDFNEAQIKQIIENAKKYDLDSSEHVHAQKLLDEHWKEAASEGGRGGVGAQFTEKDYEPSEAGKKKLKAKGAGVLSEQFDEKEFRAKWELARDTRNAKRDYAAAQLLEKTFKQQGDEDKAAKYAQRQRDLAHRFPDLDGGKVQKEMAKVTKKKDEQAKGIPEKKLAEKKAKQDEKAKEEKSGEKARTKTPAKVTPAKKKVEHTSKMGLDFHTKDTPYKTTNSKIKGTDIAHGDASYIFEKLRDSKAKDIESFVKKEIEPIWDDEGGKNKFTPAKGKKFVQQFIDMFREHGHMAQEEK